MPESLSITCRICGGDFVIPASSLISDCPACGTSHTRPRATATSLADLRRAHHLRKVCDFTNAAASYRRVLNIHPDEVEALWGLALCKYGVEYVRDEKSGTYEPTIHFLNRRPFTEDPDCCLAIARADETQRPRYQQDAAYIDSVQQGVLAAEQRGDSWDVFLCYKASVPDSSDPNARTHEFRHASDLYLALHDAGFSVFFAHTTLRQAAGANYEAQIFHALQSAKVMLVITSDPAYLNTPWVHSEWSRYLERVDAREDCRLIPLLYDGCDPYALPDEFLKRSLQALAMDSLTALDDLRGILTMQLKRNEQPTAMPTPGSQVSRALLRITMALEDGKWQKAESLAEALIDDEPDCSEAHLSLLLAQRQVATLTALAGCSAAFADDVSWKRAYHFADAALQKEMTACLAQFEAYQQETTRRAAEEKAHREAEAARRAAEKKARIEAEAARHAAEEKARIEAEAARRAAEEKARIEAEVARHAAEEKARIEAEAARRAAEEKARIEAEAARQERLSRLRTACLHTIAAGSWHTVGLRTNGAVVAGGYNDSGRCDVSGWWDVVAIAAGEKHTVGLRSDGTVVAVGSNCFGQCNVSTWRNVIAVAAGYGHTVGLRTDGTIVAVGSNSNGQCDVGSWRDVVAIAAGDKHTVGLRKDGTVVAVGSNNSGQCDVSGWRDVMAIAAGYGHTVGLRWDSTVVAVGSNVYGQRDISSWRDVVAIATGCKHTLGLRSDGTVIATGYNKYGQCDVGTWRDVVAIAAGELHTLGLRADGTVVAVGSKGSGQCDVSGWRLKQFPRPTLPR